jgi:hypothetical protein
MKHSLEASSFRCIFPCALLVMACCGLFNTAFAQPDSKGNDFWICFPGNISDAAPQLYITSELASTVTVSIPGLAFNQVVNIAAGGSQVVTLPATAQVQTQFVADNKGIHITATTEVTVYGKAASSDGYLAIPVNVLLSSTTYNSVTSNEPILVGQYSRSSDAMELPQTRFLHWFHLSSNT